MVATLFPGTVRVVGVLILVLTVSLVLPAAAPGSVDRAVVGLGTVRLLALVSIGTLLARAVSLLALTEACRTARLPLTLLQPVPSLLSAVRLLTPLLAGVLSVLLTLGVRLVPVLALLVALSLLLTLLVPSVLLMLLTVLVLTVLMPLALSLLVSVLTPLLALLVTLGPLPALLVMVPLLVMPALLLVAPHAGNDVFDRFGDAALVAVLVPVLVSTACVVLLSLVRSLTASMDALRVVVLARSYLLSFVSVLTEVMWEVCHSVWARTAVIGVVVRRLGDCVRPTATSTERL